MEMNNSTVNTNANGETSAGSQGSGESTGFDTIKNSIADKLHDVAAALNEKAAEQGAHSDMAQYEKQASEWLGQSAEYVRQFDYEQAESRVRECIRQSPGRSLLIAGAVGLIIGAIVRRR